MTAQDPAHRSGPLTEADRLMTVCNSCRYCEGLCAVFPAMEMRRAFPDGDLNYLANLCHGCGACYYDCQFAPPHEFNVNVPKVLAEVRNDSYRSYVWPRWCAGMFDRNGLWISIISALSVAAFIAGFVAYRDPSVLFGVHTGPGAFYRLMPHNAMAFLFGVAFLYAIIAIIMSVRLFWRSIAEPLGALDEPLALWDASKDAGQLRYLNGGEVGCYNEDEYPTDRRRNYHHLTFYGFLLCFASTSVATVYHYFLGRIAPYPWWDLPVVLGTVGGVGMLIGTVGLLAAKLRRDPAMIDEPRLGMDMAFIAILFLTSLTGLLLLVLRETAAMGVLLAVHLGVVFAFFITLPYSKFVHGIYRWVALVRFAKERRLILANEAEAAATTSTGQGGTRP
ncbi:MAG TPA: tricarballylate utilization 4Fe-4S protein TcuB [Beijerinckiaceae bacterium]|nr:tricarballylate utilization 4Fe-4S protein TcuB [Beijerinckiaceae bacterium]